MDPTGGNVINLNKPEAQILYYVSTVKQGAKMKLNKSNYQKMYNSWRGMRERCLNPNHKSYEWYGGKGITVESTWCKFKVFAEWALAMATKMACQSIG